MDLSEPLKRLRTRLEAAQVNLEGERLSVSLCEAAANVQSALEDLDEIERLLGVDEPEPDDGQGYCEGCGDLAVLLNGLCCDCSRNQQSEEL